MMKAAVICVLLLVTAVAGQEVNWWRIPQAQRRPLEYAYVSPKSQRAINGFIDGYSWYEARDICLAAGGDLVSFEDKAEEDDVHNVLRLTGRIFPYWTGLNRLEWIDSWQWTDRTYLDREYAEGPYSSLRKQDRNKKCALMNWAQASLSAENCGIERTNYAPHKIAIMCKREQEPRMWKFPPPRNFTAHCPSNWTDAGTNSSRCYKYFGLNKEVTWKFAEGSCLSLPLKEPNLACANTQEEVDTLTSMALAWSQQDRTEHNPGIERERAWFGLRRDSLKDSWIWADNSRINKRNFHDFISMKSDYGNGYIDASAMPPGSWDVSTEEDGVRATAASYVCQVDKTEYRY